jgi:hypothetical protein
MRAFTLIEIALVIFIITVLTSISLRFTVFSPETLYLKNFVYKFGSNINLIKDLSLGRNIVNNQKVCGYGMLISSSSYYGYVFATSSVLDCDTIASSSPESFAPISPILYLHTNGDIRESPIDTLQMKDNFKAGLSMAISTTSGCSNNLLPSYYSEIALIYYNPYSELLLLGKNLSNWYNLLSSNWENIYFCLQFKNEDRYLKINRSGQMLIIRP